MSKIVDIHFSFYFRLRYKQGDENDREDWQWLNVTIIKGFESQRTIKGVFGEVENSRFYLLNKFTDTFTHKLCFR